MRKFAHLLLALLLVTLPLRGLASEWLPPCTTDEAPVAAAHDGCPEHESSPAERKAPADHAAHCSHCVACAGVAPMSNAALAPALAMPATAIPFHDRPCAGFVPERLDRPPLSA